MIHLEATKGRIHLRLEALPMGQDLCVLLMGGEREHLGAVALSTGKGPTSLSLATHREDELAAPLAHQLSSFLGQAVCVVCGIHLDHITREEIETVRGMTEELGQRLMTSLSR